MHWAVVRSSDAFRALQGCIIHNPAVLIRKCGNIHPFPRGPVFHAQHVRVECTVDRNWVYYWLDQRTFPRAKFIELSAHPCDPAVLEVWGANPSVRFTLDTMYMSYKRRWAPDHGNIVLANLREQDGRQVDEERLSWEQPEAEHPGSTPLA